MMRETRAALAETGLGVLDIEFVRITPETDLDALEPFLAAGAELGARHLIAAPYDHDLGRLAATASPRSRIGPRPTASAPVLEFFPWTVVPDLAAAAAVDRGGGSPGPRHPRRHAAFRPLGQPPRRPRGPDPGRGCRSCISATPRSTRPTPPRTSCTPAAPSACRRARAASTSSRSSGRCPPGSLSPSRSR